MLTTSNIPNYPGKYISYIRSGLLLHIVTLIEITVLISSFIFTDIKAWIWDGGEGYRLFFQVTLLSMPVFAQLDARARYQNYKLVKDQLYIYGFQTRIVKPFIKSRCQRDAAFTAANELGMGDKCKIFFKTNGYKWYHILPDVVFSKPQMLFTKKFWITTLFVKSYHPRFDFNANDPNEKNISKRVRFASCTKKELLISSSAIS